jgi:hypothetical protein
MRAASSAQLAQEPFERRGRIVTRFAILTWVALMAALIADVTGRDVETTQPTVDWPQQTTPPAVANASQTNLLALEMGECGRSAPVTSNSFAFVH